MKTIVGKYGKEYLYPKRMFCRQSLVGCLQEMVRRPGFTEKCRTWSSEREKSHPDMMCDVHDGRIWKETVNNEGQSFQEDGRFFGLSLNFDLFQPFDNTNPSTGVLYMSILNLPVEERMKEENIIPVAIIPGPKEPAHDINNYLRPIVDELLQLWNGVKMEDNSLLKFGVYRAALLAIVCDGPAARKISGFPGHGAELGKPTAYCLFYNLHAPFQRSESVFITSASWLGDVTVVVQGPPVSGARNCGKAHLYFC